MSKGSYTVYKPERPNSKLNSWKSCTCSLLIFAVISLIIILVAWPLKKSNEVDIFTGESANYKYTESVEIFPVKNESSGTFAKIIGSTTATSEETHISTKSFENKDLSKIKSALVTNKSQETTTELQGSHGKFNNSLISVGGNSSIDQPEKNESTITEVYENTSYTSMKKSHFNDNKTGSSDEAVTDDSTVTEVHQNASYTTMKNLHFNENKTESSNEAVKDESIVTEIYKNASYTTLKNVHFNDNKSESSDEVVTDDSIVTEVHQNASYTTMKNLHFNDNETESSNEAVKDESIVTEIYQNASYTTLKNVYFNDNKSESSDEVVTDDSIVTEVHQNASYTPMKNLHFNDNETESSNEAVKDESIVTEVYQNASYTTLKNLHFNDNKSESPDEAVTDNSIVTEIYQNASYTTMKNLNFNDNKTESSEEAVTHDTTVTEVHQNASHTFMKNLPFNNDSKTESSDEAVTHDSTVTEVHQNASLTFMKNLPFNDNKTESSDEAVTHVYQNSSYTFIKKHFIENKTESSHEEVKEESSVTEEYQNASYTFNNLHFNKDKPEPIDHSVKDESAVTQVYQNSSYTSMKNIHFNNSNTESSDDQEGEGKYAVTEVYQYALSHSTDISVKGSKLIDNITITIDQQEKGVDAVTEQYQSASTQLSEEPTTVNDKNTYSTQTPETASTEAQSVYNGVTDFSQTKSYDNNQYSTRKSHTNNVLMACQSTIRDENICDTNTCKNIGSKVLTLMKHDENICNNFYNYACGGISKDFLVKEESSADLWNRLKHSLDGANENSSDYLLIFKKFFLSCMNYDSWNELPGNILEDVGTFYSLSDDFNSAPTLTKLLTTLLTKNYAALFDVKIDIDVKTQKLGLVILPVFNDDTPVRLNGNIEYKDMCLEISNIEQGTLNLNYVYSSYKTCQLDKSLYISNMKRALLAFNANCSETEKIAEISQVLFSFENNILKGLDQSKQPPMMEQNNIFKTKSSSISSLRNLQNTLPQIEWSYLFKELTGSSLPDDVNIQIYFPSYLRKLLKLLDDANKREIHNSILAMYVRKLYKDYILDQRDICDKPLHCLKLSSKHMQDISSALYLESFKENEIKGLYKNANDIFEHLRKSLLKEIQNGNWLSKEDPENRAYDKIYDLTLTTVQDLIQWKDKDNLMKGLKELNIKSDCFIENTKALEEHNRKLLYSSFGSDPMLPKNLWSVLSLPFATKPSNINSLNTIVLPLGAMTRYLDYPDSPKFVSMAELGFTLAKQMNYVLEQNGIQILRKIDLQPHNEFFEINQTIDGRALTVDLNPNELITEIVTDVAGAKLAYLAYTKPSSKKDFPLIWTNMTTSQSYFLLLAQQFCTKKSILKDYLGLFEGTKLPAMFAVNSMTINTVEFFEAYNNCSPETNMTAGIRIPLINSPFTTEKYDPMDTTK